MTTTWRDWHVSINNNDIILRDALASAEPYSLNQEDVPLIIQLVENPRFDLPWIDIFPGAVDLKTHDCIHILLGRGFLAMDEAFVIGFTMGSTNRTDSLERLLYSWVSRYFYPEVYQFNDDELAVFTNAVYLGHMSSCQALDQVEYEPILDMSLSEVRKLIGIEDDLIKAWYKIEKKRYPDSPASQRLLS